MLFVIFILVATVSSYQCANDECSSTECCSQYGWCGTSSAHCGEGCTGGPCTGSTPKPVPAPKAAPKSNPVPVPKPAPSKPVPVPVSKPVTPKSNPVPVPVASPQSSGACSDWKVATMSGYDNLDGGDDKNPSCLNDFCGTSDGFLNAHPAASILYSDWNTYKFHKVEIKRADGKTGIAEIWDQCRNEDCPNQGSDPTCCTTNAKAFGGNFLLDLDRHALKNLFGITKYDDTWEKVTYRICESFDPKPIVSQWKLKGGRVADESTDGTTDAGNGGGVSGVQPWVWALVGIGALVVVGLIVLAVFLWRRKPNTETF